jgi:hypothetical protein
MENNTTETLDNLLKDFKKLKEILLEKDVEITGYGIVASFYNKETDSMSHVQTYDAPNYIELVGLLSMLQTRVSIHGCAKSLGEVVVKDKSLVPSTPEHNGDKK